MKISILLLAAGQSSRMNGSDKLLRKIDGIPLLRRSALSALDSNCDVIVATKPSRISCIDDLPLQIVEGGVQMSDSIRIGLENITADAVIISLADMPDIGADHYNSVIDAYKSEPKKKIFRAQTKDGIPGHPVLFDRRYFDELMHLDGDIGPRAVLDRHSDKLVAVPTPGRGCVVDLDTEADWENWQK